MALTPSAIGKALAALRKPANMKRGNSEHYRKLASLRKNPGRKQPEPKRP